MTEASRDAFRIERSRAVEPIWYEAPYPPGREPRQYQHAGVEYALGKDHALIGDAPGVGKTAQSILISNAIEAERTLVVVPASLRLNWEREIWAWSTIPSVRTYPTLQAKDGVSPQAHYEIISYDLLRNPAIKNAIMDLRWDHLIMDEAHFLKDPKGNARTKALLGHHEIDGTYHPGIVDACGRFTMLSGTIMPNQPIECYNAIRLLDWEAIDEMSLDAFREYYYAEGGGFITGKYTTTDAHGDPVTKYGSHWSDHVRNVPRHLDELRGRLRSSVMIRRLKQHVLPELPPKQWHVFPMTSTPAIRKALKNPIWQRVENMYEMDPTAFNSSVPIDGEISTARRELGEAKAPQVVDYIHELFLEGIDKVIIGAWHHTVLSYLREELAQYGVAYMDGKTSARKKQAEVDRFQNDKDVGIMLGQHRPLGMGWPLTAAQDVVLAEFDWVPGNNDQLVDRPHRPGQLGSYVLGHVPVVPDTLEERILGSAIEKDVSIHRALDG